MYCVNHSSNVEPPILYAVLHKLLPRLLILYKAELQKIPILATGFDFVGFVPIERGNREQSSKAIDRAVGAAERRLFVPRLSRRDAQPDRASCCRSGRARSCSALRAQVPIVPVAIAGAREAMRKGSPIIRPVTVRVRLGPPIETAGTRARRAATS